MKRLDYSNELNQHVVICNCNEKVKIIVEELQNSSTTESLDVVLLVQDTQLWEANPSWHPFVSSNARFIVFMGCPTDKDVLQRAGISRARAAIILADPKYGKLADAPSSLTAIAIERENPQVHTVMELIFSLNRPHLETTEVNEIICIGEISEKLIALSCITPGVKNIFENLLTTEDGTPQIFLVEIPRRYCKMTFRQMARRAILNLAPFIIMGYIIKFNSQTKFIINPKAKTNPGKDTILKEGSKLIVISYSNPDLEKYLSII